MCKTSCIVIIAQGDLYINKPINKPGIIRIRVIFVYGWLVPDCFCGQLTAKLRILTILYIFVVVHENLGNNMLEEIYLVHG